MDPRPYHFEYRRPRLANPTFESNKLYGSLYAFKDYTKPMPSARTPNPQVPKNSYFQLPQKDMNKHRSNSTDLNSKKQVELQGIGSYRYGSKGQLEPATQEGRSKMAGIGNSLMRNSSMDQTQVYKRQERQFNIINFHQKQYKPNLRQFPKITLEDRLFERASLRAE